MKNMTDTQQKVMEARMKNPIYRLPCTYTGLDAELDNCDPPAIVNIVDAGAPMSDGCVERYRTADGYLVDCSIDFVDFADWFGQELEEVDA